jgi:hypothetical protein
MTRIIALEKEVKELRDHQMAIGLSIQESATEAFSATTVAPTAPSAAPAAPSVKPASFVKPAPSKEMEWTKVVKKQPRARNPASAPKLPPRSSNKNLSRKIHPVESKQDLPSSARRLWGPSPLSASIHSTRTN